MYPVPHRRSSGVCTLFSSILIAGGLDSSLIVPGSSTRGAMAGDSSSSSPKEEPKAKEKGSKQDEKQSSSSSSESSSSSSESMLSLITALKKTRARAIGRRFWLVYQCSDSLCHNGLKTTHTNSLRSLRIVIIVLFIIDHRTVLSSYL